MANDWKALDLDIDIERAKEAGIREGRRALQAAKAARAEAADEAYDLREEIGKLWARVLRLESVTFAKDIPLPTAAELKERSE